MDVSVLVAVGVFLLVTLVVKKQLLGKKRLPGPWGLPVVGYIPFLSRKPYLDFDRLAKKYGNVYSIRLGTEYIIVLNDFQSAKDAFAQDAFMGRPPVSPFDMNKETLETKATIGLPWKEQRRFSLHMLRDLGLGKSKMEEHMQEEITDLLENFKPHVGKPFFVREFLAASMSNNIASLVFGKRYKYDDPIREMMTKTVNGIGRAAGQVSWQVFFPWLRNILKFLNVGEVDKVKQVSVELRKYIRQEIKNHEASLNPNSIRDFIDGYLLEIKKRVDDPCFCVPVLEDLVYGFFGAGSETVRLSLDWLLLTAASHQDSQRRIQAEIDDVTGRNRLLAAPDIKVMPYTDAFIMELMRWRSIIPINIIRYTLTDTELHGFFIPKHSQVFANLWSIHHDPEYWGSDSEGFHPERFLSEDGKKVKKWDHYIPFSIGKRACPGEPLAKVEVFLYFASILQKFNVRLPDGKTADFEGELGIGLQPKLQELILTLR